MATRAKKFLEIEKSYYEEAIARWCIQLKEKGMPEQKVRRDSHLRHLKAKLRQTNRRLSVISIIEKRDAGLALQRYDNR